eukprot:2056832-Pleurochrysis_carterae.AAC.3
MRTTVSGAELVLATEGGRRTIGALEHAMRTHSLAMLKNPLLKPICAITNSTAKAFNPAGHRCTQQRLADATRNKEVARRTLSHILSNSETASVHSIAARHVDVTRVHHHLCNQNTRHSHLLQSEHVCSERNERFQRVLLPR